MLSADCSRARGFFQAMKRSGEILHDSNAPPGDEFATAWRVVLGHQYRPRPRHAGGGGIVATNNDQRHQGKRRPPTGYLPSPPPRYLRRGEGLPPPPMSGGPGPAAKAIAPRDFVQLSPMRPKFAPTRVRPTGSVRAASIPDQWSLPHRGWNGHPGDNPTSRRYELPSAFVPKLVNLQFPILPHSCIFLDTTHTFGVK